MLAMSYVVMNFCVVFGICDAVTVGTDQRTKNSQVRFSSEMPHRACRLFMMASSISRRVRKVVEDTKSFLNH